MTSDTCRWLHEILADLPSIRHPFDIEKLPDNGVYFFYEKGELYGHCSENRPRIVRIGTHREGNFKSRIKDHFLFNESKMNFDKTRSPPHDRSIFRKNLGRAILNNEKNVYLKIWDIDYTTRENRKELSDQRNIKLERKIEAQVTTLLQYNFSFKYLIIKGQERRIGSKGIESRLIGTLSQCDKCMPSKEWLGNHSPVSKIRDSGLWQYQHLTKSPISESDKTQLLEFVESTKEWMGTQ